MFFLKVCPCFIAFLSFPVCSGLFKTNKVIGSAIMKLDSLESLCETRQLIEVISDIVYLCVCVCVFVLGHVHLCEAICAVCVCPRMYMYVSPSVSVCVCFHHAVD